MRQHVIRSQPLTYVMRDAFSKTARIYEDQRGTVFQYDFRQPVVDLGPHLVAGDGAEFVLGNFDGELHVTSMADVDDVSGIAEKLRDLLDRIYRGRKPDALQPGPRQPLEPCDRQGQMRATLVVGDGVNLVNDYGAHSFQHLTRFLRGQQYEQRFGGRDEHVRRLLEHLRPLPDERVARANGGAN